MSNKKEDVNEALTCLICSKKYTDPRLLPCGEGACNKCIQKASNSNNEFDCKFCNKTHIPVEEHGFLVNRPLLILLKANDENVHRNFISRVEKRRKEREENN
jgi:hypothetical protein